MAISIRYRAQCVYCKKWFEPGHAYLQRRNGRWECQCTKCFQERRDARNKGDENGNP